MAIKKDTAKKKENKFDTAVEELDEQEAIETKRSEKAVKNIAGSKTKIIVDKNGRTREIKVAEKRKTLPIYIPQSLYEQFDEITTSYGISNNAAICQMIKDYVTDKREIIDRS